MAKGNSQESIGTSARLTIRVVFFMALYAAAIASSAFADEKLPVLKVGNETYNNVTIITVSATDISFISDKGIANAHLKDLDPELQKHFGYDATRSEVVEQKQAQANVRYQMEVQGASHLPDNGYATPSTAPLISTTNDSIQMAFSPALERVKEMHDQLAVLYQQGKSTQALTLAITTLKLSDDALGSEHPITTMCLTDLGWMYQNVGDLADAEPIFKRCLEMRERILGPDHPWTAQSIYNLANCYMHMGKYPLAEPLYERGLAIDIKLSGPESVIIARDMARLAENESGLGDFGKAGSSMQRNLAIIEKLEGPENPDTGPILYGLGMCYGQMGNFAKSESFFQRALAIQEKNPGPEHPFTALTLSGLGKLYMEMGDYPKAEPLIQRAVKIDENVFGPESPKFAVAMRDLSFLYLEEGNFKQADLLTQRILAIYEKTPGTASLQIADEFNMLGAINFQIGNSSKAESYNEQGLVMREQVLGPEHPLVAASLEGLAAIHMRSGEFSKAEPLLQRALKIDEEKSGLNNPATDSVLDGLAEVYFDLQKTNQSLEFADKSERNRLAMLANILSFTSERQRLTFEAQFDPYFMFASLNDARRMAQTVLQHKGVVLDSLLEDQVVVQASKDSEVRALIEQLAPAKQQLTQLLMAAPKDLDSGTLKSWAETRDKLSSHVEQMEGALAQKVAGLGHARRALTATVEQVQEAIPPRAVLLEFVRYHHYLGHQRWESRYGAVVLASEGEPKWVCLGASKDIEKNVLLCQQAVRVRKDDDETKLSTALHQLYQQIWAPIETLLPRGTKTVIISPDGTFNFISFATLLTPHDRFLAESYSIRYVATGRDLLRSPVKPLNQEMVVFAAPDYNAGNKAGLPQSGIQLNPLPFFAKNAAVLEAHAKEWRWPVQVYLGAKATETQLRNIHSPRILHFATHGFFLPESIHETDHFNILGFSFNFNEPQPRVLLTNPMSRSGIALAGAETTLDAWQRGEIPMTDSDGILTAEEVGGLDLRGTWLVVLSACDTGIGQWRSGEGVMGLRRGFAQAGAQNLLMTLWPVFDVPSGQLMLDFYSRLHEDNNPAEALVEVQRDSLIKLRSKYGLLSAVVMAGAFIVNSQGPVQ